MLVLTLNVGSSSLKSAVYDLEVSPERHIFSAAVTTGGAQAVVAVTSATGVTTTEARASRLDSAGAIAWTLTRLEQEGLSDDLVAVGHRLVHDGGRYPGPVWLTPDVLASLQQLIPLAPEHLPGELAAIDAVSHRWSRVRQAASFDTSFHASLPAYARLFGVPRSVTDSGVIRFGFHGLSYEYVVGALRAAGALSRRTVIAHLGSGASLAAIADGRSVDTTMGFTPAGGVIMATRSGDLDPGVLLYLARTQKMSVDALGRMVNGDGGLAGISGTTGDMRTLLDRRATDPRAAEAVEVFCYQVSKAIAAMATALDGVDTIVFTGGIGEHAGVVRARVCERLTWLGVSLDETLNGANASVISRAEMPVTVRIMPTNEEVMIARHVRGLLRS